MFSAATMVRLCCLCESRLVFPSHTLGVQGDRKAVHGSARACPVSLTSQQVLLGGDGKLRL